MFVNLNKKLDKQNYSYKSKRLSGFKKNLVRILVVLVILLIIPSIFIYLGFKEVSSHSKSLVAAYKEQNYDQLKNETAETKKGLQKMNFALTFLIWLKAIPLVGGYYSDVKGLVSGGVEDLTALDTILTNLESSKAELGFDNHPKSGPDRVSQALKILDKTVPILEKVEGNLKKGAEAVKDIDTGKYPEKLKNKEIKKSMEVAKNFILGAAIAVGEGKEALTLAPAALGIPSSKNYLLLFQNDKEIRATGGFMTAFATLQLERGQVSSTTSDDIYRLDEKLLNVCLTKICPLTPPPPIVKYLPEASGKPRSAWSMRDSNLSPDVPTSAKEFERMFQLLGESLPFDGIIYIDSQVVEALIEVTGPIDVFGTKYSAELDKRCNCPNVIYELESYAEIAAKGEKDRKAVLGVLMQQILAKALGSDVEKLPQLIETLATLANHKHVMFYVHDLALQAGLSKLNWTGEIKNYEGDFLHINDSNFAGGKSNLYVDQIVTQEIQISGGKVTKKVTVEYKNPQAFNTWLNGINRDYVRFYVPKGSKLISSKGSEDQVNTMEDLGKTVFDAFIQVRPGNSRKLEMEYELPYKPSGEYKLLIQKQPGAKDFKYTIKINGSQKADFKLDRDKEFKFGI